MIKRGIALVKGIYTAASGMMLQQTKQDVLANNIANSNTNSFKRQLAIASEYPTMQISRYEKGEEKSWQPIGPLGNGAVLSEVTTDFSMGSIVQTGVTTDMVLGENNYFVVETPQGERFTRSGSFKVNYEGLLTTSQGFPLLDDNGEYIFTEPGFTVDKQGNITVDGVMTATLLLLNFDDRSALAPIGDNLYVSDDDNYIEAEDPQLMQGFLEQSNANAVREMVTLLEAVRTYEMLQKAVQAEDELIQTAVDKVAAIG